MLRSPAFRSHLSIIRVFAKLCNAGNKIPKAICKVRIIYVLKLTFGKISVCKRRDMAQKIIAKRIGSVLIDKFDWINYISQTLGHFLPVNCYVFMDKNIFWQNKP